jgi:hypothetical protein
VTAIISRSSFDRSESASINVVIKRQNAFSLTQMRRPAEHLESSPIYLDRCQYLCYLGKGSAMGRLRAVGCLVNGSPGTSDNDMSQCCHPEGSERWRSLAVATQCQVSTPVLCAPKNAAVRTRAVPPSPPAMHNTQRVDHRAIGVMPGRRLFRRVCR